MFELIKKTFIGLLTGIVSTSNLLKRVSLSNQKCMTQVLEVVILLMNHLIKYMFQNLSVFIMITGTNYSKTLTEHISCECKCKFDGRRCNSD